MDHFKNSLAAKLALFSCFGFIMLPFHASAQWADAESDDSDYTAGYNFSSEEIPLQLGADRLDTVPSVDGTTIIELAIQRPDGTFWPIDGLSLSLSVDGIPTGATHTWNGGYVHLNCTEGQIVTGVARLSHEKFRIKQSRGEYSLNIGAHCGLHNRFVFLSDSPAGQAMGIWRIAFGAVYKLSQTVGLDFWRRTTTINWPGSADFYRWGSVHLTRGDHWDVVGHELGHAIYDMADIGRFGGGQHYIDRCYSGSLALSEGWASYFSAWLSVALDDSDAKFEFMVPRRAPVRFENVPEDVCRGPNNEWRVNAYFWDIIDWHNDNEEMNDTFARVWTALLGTNSVDVGQAHLKLIQSGLDSTALTTIWNLNFQQ
jgi:hypothetical protein